jgi:hypothetical protein
LPTPSHAACKAVMRYVQKVTGSLSPLSKDNQAMERGGRSWEDLRLAIQVLIKVVFPKPGGADMSVSLQPGCRLPSNFSSRSDRTTRLFPVGGISNLVARMGIDIALTKKGSFTLVVSHAEMDG